ncbi:MAG: hypothetical protein QMB52_16025 [Propionivibrio sp.]
MLTRRMLGIFEEFDGDIDGWTRMHRDPDNSLMTAEDWSLIDRLVMNLGIAESGLASPEFRAETEKILRENTADETTREAVRDLAARLNRKSRS